MKVISVLLVAASLMVSAAHAESTMKVGTGSKEGNYFTMLSDVKSYCEPNMSTKLDIQETDGSVTNITGIQTKKFSAGVVQEDVLRYYANRLPNDYNKNQFKVIMGLHREVLHLLIPNGYAPSSDDGNLWASLFSSKKNPSAKFELSMLKGQKVGTWGGSIVSAEALSHFFGLNLSIVDIPKELRNPNNTQMPILLVGGAPYKVVETFLSTGKWTLAPLNYETISQTVGFYSREMVNYQVQGKMVGTPTIGVRALLIGKSFRNKDRNAPMTDLATCITENLADLADDPNTNPLWGSVYKYVQDNGQVDWSYFPMKAGVEPETANE